MLINLFLLLLFAFGTISHPLLQQISNTRELIQLYQQKLEVLLQMAEQQNISLHHKNTQINQQQNFTIFKPVEQIIVQVNVPLGQNVRFVPPRFLSSGNSVIDLNNMQEQVKIQGTVVAVEPFQVTSFEKGKGLTVKNFREAIQEKVYAIQNDGKGKWHRSTQYQDMFLTYFQSTITLASQKQKKQYRFKQKIVDFYYVNQYKIFYVTENAYGYLNVKTFQNSDSVTFQEKALASYFKQGTLFILFKNMTISIVKDQKIISRKLQAKVSDNMKISYLGQNYLILHSHQNPCFNIYEMQPPNYQISYLKQICILDSFSNHNQIYQFQFLKNNEHFMFIVSNGENQSKLFQIILPEKPLDTQKGIPWKLILIVCAILAVVYFKSLRSGRKNTFYEPVTKKQVKKEQKRSKSQQNFNEQYINTITAQFQKSKQKSAGEAKKKLN